MTWHVYLIEDGSAVKMGRTYDVERRLAFLQCGNPRELRLSLTKAVGTIEHARALETKLHNACAEFHIRGEWFALDALPVAKEFLSRPSSFVIGPLQRFFRESGKTQSELGAFCGTTQATVSRWVSGRVPDEQLDRVSKFTGIPAAELRPDLAKLFKPSTSRSSAQAG